MQDIIAPSVQNNVLLIHRCQSIKFGVEDILKEQASLYTLPFEGMDSSFMNCRVCSNLQSPVKKSVVTLFVIVVCVQEGSFVPIVTLLVRSLLSASTGFEGSVRKGMTVNFFTCMTWGACPSVISMRILENATMKTASFFI
jgi:hypothetical protein